MTISLSPELENFVNEKVNSGAYPSANDAVTDILQKFREDEILQGMPFDELRQEIQKGLDSHARGEYIEYDTANIVSLAEEIKAEGRRRKAERASHL